MDRFFENLKTQAEENPVFALGVAAGLVTATSKLIDALGKAKNSRAWAKEVNRRAAKDLRKK
jgi:hypothetical protein